jgi:hypothetical protein
MVARRARLAQAAPLRLHEGAWPRDRGFTARADQILNRDGLEDCLRILRSAAAASV